MLSFSSHLTRGGAAAIMQANSYITDSAFNGADKISTAQGQIYTESTGNKINYDQRLFNGDASTILNNTITRYGGRKMQYNFLNLIQSVGPNLFENPYKIPSSVIGDFSKYEKIFSYAVAQTIEASDVTGDYDQRMKQAEDEQNAADKQNQQSQQNQQNQQNNSNSGNNNNSGGTNSSNNSTTTQTTAKKTKLKPRQVAVQQTNLAMGPSSINPLYGILAKGVAETTSNLYDSENHEHGRQYVVKDLYSLNLSLSPNKGTVVRRRVVRTNTNTFGQDFTDCSIRRLVSDSKRMNLGAAGFRYADFMYCKDLGKVSNNHLIVLRKFGSPVGDHIGKLSRGKYVSTQNSKGDYNTLPDQGRLVAWFGTGDNKLEDIMKYDVQATWKEFNSKIEEVQSQEDDAGRGPLGAILNSLNPGYNAMQAGGWTGQHNIVAMLMGRLHPSLGQAGQNQNHKVMSNYDKNRIYEPKNTIQATHQYEGKLILTHEFNLTFSYKIRQYSNVNQKAAMLDILANILAVTYRAGTFWGGSRKFIGPPPNRSGWNKANAMIDNAWEKLGGVFKGLADGSIDFKSLLSSIGEGVKNLLGEAASGVKKILNGGDGEGNGKTPIQNIFGGLVKFNEKTGISNAIKGQLKNALGRPAIYAMDSLLSGDNVGLWHLTVGNPYNPIASFGNLIMTKASIQHLGPLGLDDFPTELKVTCTLKHGRSRDKTEIERMYTNGINSIYSPLRERSTTNYYKLGNNSNDLATSLESYEEYKENNFTKYEKIDSLTSSMISTSENKYYTQELMAREIISEAQSDFIDSYPNKEILSPGADEFKQKGILSNILYDSQDVRQLSAFKSMG